MPVIVNTTRASLCVPDQMSQTPLRPRFASGSSSSFANESGRQEVKRNSPRGSFEEFIPCSRSIPSRKPKWLNVSYPNQKVRLACKRTCTPNAVFRRSADSLKLTLCLALILNRTSCFGTRCSHPQVLVSAWHSWCVGEVTTTARSLRSQCLANPHPFLLLILYLSLSLFCV